VIACGGAGSLAHLHEAFDAHASAAAAGSLFVFQGPHRAVLISYPTEDELRAARPAPRAR
jgi:cyclase